MVRRVCATCERLDLEAYFSGEINVRCVGNLSTFQAEGCPFCRLIRKAVRTSWKKFDSLDGGESLYSSLAHPCKLYLQSRCAVTIKRSGRSQHLQPRLLLAVDRKPAHIHLNRAAIREVDNIGSRFIIAELEKLPSADDNEVTLYARRRHVQHMVEPSQIKGWIAACQDHSHSKTNPSSMRGEGTLFSPDRPFRLIDVQAECLVLKSKDCPYAALSYVWGEGPTLIKPGDDKTEIPVILLLDQNRDKLSLPGGLSVERLNSRATGQIPQTVRDAMKLAKDIGIPYLWVDTLCIVQDDEVDKDYLMNRMDDVYNSATVTLVAAAGQDPHFGLCGVSPRAGLPVRPRRMAIGLKAGSELSVSVVLPSLCDIVRATKWNTRGWTFQEQALSQRCLYFTENEVFFNCSHSQRREAYDYGEKHNAAVGELTVRTGPPWWSGSLRKDPDPTPYRYVGNAGLLPAAAGLQEYQKAIQSYSRRSLTNPADVLNAFKGIFNRLRRPGDPVELSIENTQGLPIGFLDHALLWFPADGSTKRIDSREETKKETAYSSWSWAAWIGPIDFVFADSAWLSRNLSFAAIKPVPLYSTVSQWHFGGISSSFSAPQLSLAAREYISEKTAIDMDRLPADVGQCPSDLPARALGFHAAFIKAGLFQLSENPKMPHAFALELAEASHRGQFRFDLTTSLKSGTTSLDELVAIKAGDTITKPPDNMTVFLGLSTKGGVSRRVGIGYIYYSRDKKVPRPAWQYRYFTVE